MKSWRKFIRKYGENTQTFPRSRYSNFPEVPSGNTQKLYYVKQRMNFEFFPARKLNWRIQIRKILKIDFYIF